MCDHEFICLQEISRLSRSVLSTVLQDKTRDSRGNILRNTLSPKVGRKRRPPTTVHVRNRATRNSVHHTSSSKKKKKSSGQSCRQNHRILKRLLNNCTKVQTDVEIRRLLQHSPSHPSSNPRQNLRNIQCIRKPGFNRRKPVTKTKILNEAASDERQVGR